MIIGHEFEVLMKVVFKNIIKDKVFVIAGIIMMITMFIIPPSTLYLSYMNYKVLIIMFTIMLAVAGLYETHLFDFIATRLVIKFKTIKWVSLILVLSTFFLAMFLTNDAVLLTLIPFTLFIMKHAKQEKFALITIILQTIAANLGSALTPMGDPQNIYLFAYYEIPFKTFLSITAPITALGFILITSTALIKIPNIPVTLNLQAPEVNWKRVGLYALLLLNALFVVLRLVPEWYTIYVTLILGLAYGRHLFKRVDYGLLLTFVAFFIITGNLGQMDSIFNLFDKVLSSPHQVFLTALGTSQIISNVPAAVLLSTFTKPMYYPALLTGVNVGALGSIIGSLASLITFKYVIREFPELMKKYLLNYTIISIIFIIIIGGVMLIIL
ncbi:MAG: SLC13 family permease [Acholeplasmataceae bacterium]|jgi:Na+/H+ antiporter NhaD/arsenite permease-like protein